MAAPCYTRGMFRATLSPSYAPGAWARRAEKFNHPKKPDDDHAGPVLFTGAVITSWHG
jgi:hypothetical protein